MSDPTFPCIPVQQPIGVFYLTSIGANELIERLRISARKDAPDGENVTNKDVQREASKKRITDIATYVTDPDATFPTAIIISADSRYAQVADSKITFREPNLSDEDAPSYANREGASTYLFGELLDGQHRIKGLRLAKSEGIDISDFELPVVVMLDLELAEKAYVFSIINSKQTPVPKSLIYDLFDLASDRSPYLTCHQVARAMNTDRNGPFYNGLKMLGKRRLPSEMLTQGSFVKYLLRLITNKPDADAIALKSNQVLKENDRPFNAFFIKERDELILKAMNSFFSAIATTFPDQWDIKNYSSEAAGGARRPTPVFRRTVGYEALMRALAAIWPEVKDENVGLEVPYFLKKARNFKANVGSNPMTTEEFGSSSADAGRLSKLLLGERGQQ